MAQGGPIPGPAVRNTPPDANDYGLVVRVVGSGGVGVIVDQGTSPWIVSDPPLEAAIDVLLSTRASEATLAALNALVVARLDVALSTRASEATLATRASEATLVAVEADTTVIATRLDVALSTRASEATLATRASEATLATRASEATLVAVEADTTAIAANIDVALSTRASEATLATRASEATLATRLADATFTSRINTLGQKLMAASTPVVIASDQSAIPVTATVASTGTLNNGTETAVGVAAVQIIAANASRKSLIIQNTGLTNMRVGAAGVTATTGVRLASGDTLILELPVATNAIFAIRETTDTTALTQEIT